LRYDETTLAFWFLTIATFCGFFFIAATEDVEGAVVQSTFNETTSSQPQYTTVDSGTHTKDDNLVNAYVSSDDELWIAYRERGGAWEHVLVDDSGSDYQVGGVINTQNNSLVILSTFITVTYRDVQIFMNFPADDWDEWTKWSVTSGAGYYCGDIAINDTEQICIMLTLTSSPYQVRYWVLDFETLTVSVGGPNGGTISTGRATTSYQAIQVIANATGRFHFWWKQNDNQYHFWDMEESITERTVGSSSYSFNEVVCLSNDRFLAAGHYQGVGKPFFYYQATHQAAVWTRTWLESVTRAYENGGMSVSITGDSDFVSIISYCNTDEFLTTWEEDYDASAMDWQTSQTTTTISDGDDITCFGHYGSLWPEHPAYGLKWTLPISGWAVNGRDESGATDELDLIQDGVEWYVDLTTDDPEITTASLPDATFDVFWEHSLTKTGGTIPFEWTLLIGPAWMSLGASNRTLYGTPDGTGTETVRVKLADAVPRYDEEEWTLTINPASSGSGGEATTFVIDEMGELWMLLMGTAVFVAIARTYKMAIWRRNQR